MLDKKISVSEQVANLPIEAQLIFTWMIPHADDFGLLPYSPRTIKALIVPMHDFTAEQVEEYLKLMVKNDLLQVIEHNGKKYYLIKTFSKHQTLKKDRQPQTILEIELEEDHGTNWVKIGNLVDPKINHSGEQKEDSDFQMVPEVKRKEAEENKTEETEENLNIGDSPIGNKPAMKSLKSVMLEKYKLDPPKTNGISKSWQSDAFRDMEYLEIKLEGDSIGRVLKVYKDESLGKKKKATTIQAKSCLKDHPKFMQLNNGAKLRYWFWIIEHGVGFKDTHVYS